MRDCVVSSLLFRSLLCIVNIVVIIAFGLPTTVDIGIDNDIDIDIDIDIDMAVNAGVIGIGWIRQSACCCVILTYQQHPWNVAAAAAVADPDPLPQS
jgi:hypothetical protein